jgi:hypothetical protein
LPFGELDYLSRVELLRGADASLVNLEIPVCEAGEGAANPSNRALATGAMDPLRDCLRRRRERRCSCRS